MLGFSRAIAYPRGTQYVRGGSIRFDESGCQEAAAGIWYVTGIKAGDFWATEILPDFEVPVAESGNDN